jgi:excisionase family DNA binding protein
LPEYASLEGMTLEQNHHSKILTLAEAAAFLRLGERSLYELARTRKIPCTRVGGKWLFERALLEAWLRKRTDMGEGGDALAPPPPIIAGSHDPLLEWAVRRSRCGLALKPGGSLDGLDALARNEAAVAGLHVVDPDTGDYNVPAIRAALPGRDMVAIEWAKREQGLIVAAGNPQQIASLADLVKNKLRFVPRQEQAGSHVLFVHLLSEAGIALGDVSLAADAALSESDVAASIVEGKADAGFGIRASAAQAGLGFVPLALERFDLVLRRRDYFEPAIQTLLAFARADEFRARAARLTGYDVSNLGRVILNQ